MPNIEQPKQILSDLFLTALKAVNGRLAVEQQLQQIAIEGDVAVIAIGKAASAMMLGAQDHLNKQIQSALIITKSGYADHAIDWPCVEAGHPVPDSQSLAAGTKLLEFLNNIPDETKILALISGGASSLVEVLPENMELKNLQEMNEWLLASGLEIHEMNRIRQSVSLIKGGKTLQHVNKNEMTQLLISDVKMDDIEIIGSGLFVASEKESSLPKMPEWLHSHIQLGQALPPISVESHIVASNDMACQAIIEHAKQANYAVVYHGQTLYGNVFELAETLVRELLCAEPGLHIWGGETTLVLPEKTGQGGRNQSLALAMACILENTKGITVLVGATDGSDGPTSDAGAIIDGLTLQRGPTNSIAQDYLSTADAGTFLAEAGDLLSTGPTGTNVMDIVIALKEPD